MRSDPGLIHCGASSIKMGDGHTPVRSATAGATCQPGPAQISAKVRHGPASKSWLLVHLPPPPPVTSSAALPQSDNPFTAEKEPSVPAIVATRLRNVGTGTARAVFMESLQPQIKENKNGLLVQFRIVGVKVNDTTMPT